MTFRSTDDAGRACKSGSLTGCTIFAEGEIVPETPERFRAFIETNKAISGTIYLNSEGGELEPALAFGRAIRQAGFNTAIPRYFTPSPLPKDCFEKEPEGSTRESPDKLDSRERLERLSYLINQCSGNVGTISYGRCRSACAYAFLGGRVRSLSEVGGYPSYMRRRASTVPEGPELLMRNSDQRELGYHLYRPVYDLDSVPDDEYVRGAEWAQRLYPDLAKYVSEMNIGGDLLAMAQRPPNNGDPEADPFYYPTVAELTQLGVLLNGHFMPFELTAQRGKLMLVSRYSNGLLWEKQAALLCVRRDGGKPALSLMVSGGADDSDSAEPRKILRLEDLGTGPSPLPEDASPSDALQASIFWTSSNEWKLEVRFDERDPFTGGQFPTEKPRLIDPKGKSMGAMTRYRQTFAVNNGWHFSRRNSPIPIRISLDHYLVELPEAQVAALRNASKITIRYSLMRSDTATIALPEDIGEKIDVLMASCLDLPKPADHADGYEFSQI